MRRRLLLFLTFFLVSIAGSTYASDCSTASTIAPELSLNESPVNGSFSGETFSGDPECTGPGARADVWYKFQANSTKMFVRAIGSGDLDLALEVLDGCGGTELQCLNSTGAGNAETALLSGLTIGNTYYFRVYHAGGTPAVSTDFTAAVSYLPTVQLKPEYCGLLEYTTNDIIKSTQPVVTDAVVYYQWRFQELDAPFATYEVISPNPTNPNMRLKWFDEIQYGMTYDVSIRLAVNPGSVVGDYGPACTIKLHDDVLTTKLEEQYNQGFFSFCDVIGCESVGGADRYRWTLNNFQDPPISCYGDGDNRLLRIYDIPGIKLGKTYIVNAYAEVNGQESPAGATRFINTNNNVPNTGLRTDIYPCGGTYPINSQVQAVEICQAQSYTWRFINTSQAQPDLFYTRTDGNRFIRLEWVTGLIPGDSYDLDIKASQGGLDGDYSTICNITIGASTSGFAGEPTETLTMETGELETNNTSVIDRSNEPTLDMTVVNNGGSANQGLVIDLASKDGNQNVRLELYDLNGKMIAQRYNFVQREGQSFTWNIPGFSSGIYILRAFNGSDVVTRKVSVF